MCKAAKKAFIGGAGIENGPFRASIFLEVAVAGLHDEAPVVEPVRQFHAGGRFR